MSGLSVRSTLVLALAGFGLAAPAPGATVRRQEEVPPANALDVLNAALSTFPASSTSTSSTSTTTLAGEETGAADVAEAVAEAVDTVPKIEPTEEEETTPRTQTDLSKDEFCDNADLKSLDSVIQVWNDRGVGKYLDDYLSENDYANEAEWVIKMADVVYPGTGNTGAYGCGSRDQRCFFENLDCKIMYDNGFGFEFWIFTAVAQMQSMIIHAHENLQDKADSNNALIASINKDFEVTVSEPNALLKFISAAFSMAGGLVAFGRFESAAGKLWRDDAKASATLFGGSFAASAAQTPASPPDASADMGKALDTIITDQISLLDDYLSMATGGEGDKNSLPDRGLVNGEEPKSAIAGFFAFGRFLLQGEDVEGYFSEGYDFISKKMVDVALAEHGYLVLADHNQEDEGMCSEQPFAYWMNFEGLDEGRCMRLTYKDGDNTYPPVSEDVMKLMQDDYKIDVKQYFDITCDCAINGGDSKEPAEFTPDDKGTPPKCFYTLGCMDAEVWLSGDNPDDDDDWVIGWPIDFKEVMSWS